MSRPPNDAPPASAARPPVTITTAQAAISDVARLIAQARQTMGEGKMVSVAQLETLCREACLMVSQLPREQGRRLRSDLEAVLYDLDALETDMTSRFGGLARRPLDAETPRPLTVGAAYQAGIARAAGLGVARPAPQAQTSAHYPPSAAPPPAAEPAAKPPATEKGTSNPYAPPPSGSRRSWTL